MLFELVGSGSSDDVTKHECGDERVIRVSDCWDEVWNEIDRQREVYEQQPDQPTRSPRHRAIRGESADEPQRVGKQSSRVS
jgi:hypothetical protein